MSERKKKTKRIAILAVCAVILAAGAVTAALLLRKPTVVIAARSEMITLWKREGIASALEQELGIRIRWEDYGTEGIYQRLQDDMTKPARALPDAYLGLGLESSQLSALIAQNSLLNLESVSETLTPNLKRLMDSDSSRIPELRREGGIYSFPALQEDLAAQYPQKAWINAQWLAQARMSIPSTPEEMLAVLRAFKAMDFNGNGIADEMPLGAAYLGTGHSTLGFLISPFVSTDYDLSESNYLNMKNGKVTAGVAEEGYKTALAYLHTLYTEGLMDSTVFTQDASALAAGTAYGVILAQDIEALLGEQAEAYAAIPPLLQEGRSFTLVRRSSIKTGGYLIPARISQPRQKLALALGDALLSSTSPACTEATAAVYSTIRGEVPYWSIVEDEVTRQYYQPVGERCIGETLPALVLSDAQSAALQSKNTYRKVIDVLKSAREFVTGKRSLETDWDTYLSALEHAGLQDIIAYTQEAYDNR